MITLKDWMETAQYRITEGSSYGWECYGPDAYNLTAWNGLNGRGGWSFSVVFDTQTQVVYEVEVSDYTNNRAYRLINLDYEKAYREEANKRESWMNEAWDGVNYTDLEVDDDWLEKAQAIAAGKEYDTNVSIPLDFSDEELLKYMIMAHERNMTFNQFVEEALRGAIEEFKRDPEGMKQRAQNYING